jgi:hypothetical protein
MDVFMGNYVNNIVGALGVSAPFPGPNPAGGPAEAGAPYFAYDTKDTVNFASAAKATVKFEGLLQDFAGSNGVDSLQFTGKSTKLEEEKANLIAALTSVVTAVATGTTVTHMPNDVTESFTSLCNGVIPRVAAATSPEELENYQKLLPGILIPLDFYSMEYPKKIAFTCAAGYNGPGCGKCGTCRGKARKRRLANDVALLHIVRRYTPPGVFEALGWQGNME